MLRLDKKQTLPPQPACPVNASASSPAYSPGFTLIELMIVLAIFTVGILGTMSMQLAAGRTNDNAREAALAMEYAADSMEQLMNLGFADGNDDNGDGIVDNNRDMWGMADLTAGPTHTRGAGDTLIADAYSDIIFNQSWVVTDLDIDGDGSSDTKQIVITVRWDNNAKWVNLVSLRSEII